MTGHDEPNTKITVTPVNVAAQVPPHFELMGEYVLGTHTAAAVEREWELLRKDNPRLFDGPVLLTKSARADETTLTCWRGSYRVLAAAARLGLNVRALGVQGVVIGRDADGDECVLLGRRGSQTRIYGGLWENAPAGTVSGQGLGSSTVDVTHLTRELQGEGLEELGIDLQAASVRWIALLDDARACSLDAVLRVDLPEPIDARRTGCRINEASDWEYADTAWVPTSRLKGWVERSGSAVSPPTLVLFDHVGWI